MYCTSCGKQIRDDSKFCHSCGEEIKVPGTVKPIDTPIKKPIPKELPANIKKKHGPGKFLKFVVFPLLSIPILVLIVLLVISIFNDISVKRDNSQNLAGIDPGLNIEKLIIKAEDNSLITDSAADEIEVIPSEDSKPSPTQDNGDEMKDYQSPIFETEIPLYTVLTNNVWELAGVAHNPDKIGGDEGIYTLEFLNDYMLSFTFNEDGTVSMVEDNQGAHTELNLQYEIMDIHYCNTYAFADGTGYRFYFGNDGLLYMCSYEADENLSDFSDFLVLKPLSS